MFLRGGTDVDRVCIRMYMYMLQLHAGLCTRIYAPVCARMLQTLEGKMRSGKTTYLANVVLAPPLVYVRP
jgi:hypothetical protein